MKKSTKIILTAGCALMGAGCVITGIGIGTGGHIGFSVTKNGITSAYQEPKDPYTLTRQKVSGFQNVDIKIGSYADIELLPSDDENYYLEYILDGSDQEPVTDIKNGTLSLVQKEYAPVTFNIFSIAPVPSSRVEASVKLYIPKETKLDSLKLFTDSGDICVPKLQAKSADLRSGYGNLELEEVQITEDAKWETNSGNLSISGCSAGFADIHNDYGDTSIDSLKGESLELRAGYGDVLLNGLDLSADAVLNVDCGSLTMNDSKAGFVTVNNSSGDTELNSVSGTDFSAEADYGDIVLKNSVFTNSFSAALESGSLSADTGNSDSLTVESSSGDITLENFKSKTAELDADYGDITFDAAALEALKCKNEYGSVSLTLPENIDVYSYDLYTDYGDITLSDSIKNGLLKKQEYGSSASFKSQKDTKALIRIEVNSGDIELLTR